MKAVHGNGLILQSECRPRKITQSHRHGLTNSPVEENLSFFVYSVPCVLSLLCYANVLNGDFVHDDVFAVRNNPDVTGQRNWTDVWSHDFWGNPMASVKSHKSYRPLTVLFFRLDYFLSHGNPTWFHGVNTLLHGCVACLVAHVCLRVLEMSQLCAVLAASLFAVHPIHTEAVSSIVGRADVLAALLFLLSFIAYTRNKTVQGNEFKSFFDDLRQEHIKCVAVADKLPLRPEDLRPPRLTTPSSDNPCFLLATSLTLAVAASLCKETGVTVMGVCILYDILCHGRTLLLLRTFSAPSLIVKSLAMRIFAVVLTACTFLLFRAHTMSYQVPTFRQEDNPASYSPSFLTRAMTFHYLIPINLWLLICPRVLCYDWQVGSIPLLDSLHDLRNGVTVSFYAIAAAILFSSLREWHRQMTVEETDNRTSGHTDAMTVLMSAALLAVPFLPASNLFFTVGFVVAERILYIPSIGFCILVSHSIVRLGNCLPKFKGHILTLTLVLILTFAGKTWHRNPVWRSRKALFMSGVQTMPTNAKAHFNMANYYKDVGHTQLAIHHYKTAIGLYPHHPSYHNNLGTTLTNLSEAEHHFRQALAIYPNHKGALVNLGNSLILQGRDEGFQLLNKSLEIDPNYVDAILSMGKALMSRERLEEAEHYIKLGLDLRPNLSEAHLHYGALCHHKGRLELALREYQTAFTLDPRNTLALKSAATSLKKLGRFSEAEALLKRALSLKDDSDSYTQLGLLYSQLGQKLDALFAYRDALAIEPNCTLTHLRYVQALVDTNQHGAANQSLARLLARESHDLDVLRFAYTLKQQMGLMEEAAPYLDDAIHIAEAIGDPSLGRMYRDKADIYRQRSDLDTSLKYYELSLERDPWLIESYINIGTIYHIQANYSVAEEFYLKALSLNPDNQLVKDNMAKLRSVWRKAGPDET